MSLPGNVLPSKAVLPPVRRLSRGLPRRSALCSPDIYEHFLLPKNEEKGNNETMSSIGKKSNDTIRSDPVMLPCMSSDPLLRITQLEQNLRFLQEQHQSMLSSLHQEIESLRIRNRDLQFQLIFGNPGSSLALSSSDSSPDDGKPKIVLSPKEVNTRPLQVEILEKEVAELKLALSEANTKNASLGQLVEFQKKQIDSIKKEKDSEQISKLDEAELLIKRLGKENEDQRQEINNLRSQLSKSSGSGSRYSGGRRGGGGGHNGGDYQRFPPLQTQNYRGHGSQKQRFSPEYHNGRGSMDQEVVGQPAPTLPHLSRTYSQPSQNQRHRYYSNGNHVYRGNGEEGEGRRRYRGRGGGGNHKEEH